MRVTTGRAPSLLFGNDGAKILVTRYLPGELVEGTAAQHDPQTFRQAGSLLAAFHGQLSVVDDDWGDRFRARVERHLARPHIDFGRADLRPPVEDFVRLARQDFARAPWLEEAFVDGYGSDPREPEEWRRTMVGEAVGTAVWAHEVGDEGFEQFGHRLLAELYD